jgi:DNA adenine methylase
MQFKLVAPILKWVGGKRQLLTEINKYIPKKYGTYYEPFIGGGAVLFHLQPPKAKINDFNGELINLYNVIKNSPEELINELSDSNKYKNISENFYRIREQDRNIKEYENMSDIEKSARMLYLNRTCYNGLYRVNSLGEFNSPFGSYKNPNIVNETTIRAINKYFSSNEIDITNCDFEEAVRGIKKGDFVYFDPPYAPLTRTSNFTGYTCSGFDDNEQIRLKELCDRLDSMGVKFLLSNSNCDFITELYKDYKIELVDAKRSINSKADGRGEVKEVLIRNYE